MTKPLSALLFLGILSGTPVISLSQDSVRIIILSPRLGRVIAAEECSRFHILPQMAGFQKAVVGEARDGSLYIQFQRVTEDGTTAFRTLAYSRTTLLMIAQKVDHFEELQAGTYSMGDVPTKLNYADSGWVKWGLPHEQVPPKPGLPPVITRHVQPPQPDIFLPNPPRISPPETLPRLAFCVGVSPYTPDLGGIDRMAGEIAAKFAAQGYAIAPSDIKHIEGPTLWFSLDLQYTRSLGLFLEAGSAREGDDAKFVSLSLSVTYHVPVQNRAVLRPFLAVGAAYTSLALNQYLPHNDRVSPVDSAGGYWYLSSITLAGGNSKTGAVMSGGLDILDPPHVPLGIRVMAKYLAVAPITIAAPGGAVVALRPAGWIFAIYGMLYF